MTAAEGTQDLPGGSSEGAVLGGAWTSPGAGDYDRRYYMSGLGIPYVESEPHWTKFFGDVADHIVRQLSPGTVLDAGCATGFLVAALARRGVDSRGVDISDYAVSAAVSGAEGRLKVQSLTEPLGGPWDLVTCIEVLEHMPVPDIHTAIDNMCASTDRVLFSSTPHDFTEASHINVKTVATWVTWFADRGFFRRTDLDLSYLSPWAMILERREMSAAAVAHAYETEMAPLREELVVKRSALLEANRQIGHLEQRLSRGGRILQDDDPEFASPDRLLSLVDQVIGLQAELAEERYRHDHDVRAASAREVANLDAREHAEARAAGAEQRLSEVLDSRSWRFGQALMGPAERFRRLIRRRQ